MDVMHATTGMTPLELGLPEGADPWWEVSAQHDDGDAPWPPLAWPADVMAAHSARLTVVRLQAASGSQALGRVEGLMPASGRCEWRIRPVSTQDVLTGA